MQQSRPDLSFTVTRLFNTATGEVLKQQSASVNVPVPERLSRTVVANFLADEITFIDSLDPRATINDRGSSNLILAKVPVGNAGVQDAPRHVAVTRDGTRAYVPLWNSQQVAVVDAISFRLLDLNPMTEQVEGIELPSGSTPSSILIDAKDQYAYVGDRNQGRIYVIDINPNSKTFNQRTKNIEVDAPEGIRRMSFNSDGTLLFATSPTSSQGDKGNIIVVNVDPVDRPTNSNINLLKWQEQVHVIETEQGVEGISATPNSRKMLFTNRKQESQGFGVIEVTNADPNKFAVTTKTTNMLLGSATDYFDVNEAVAVTITPDAEYAFVAGRNGRLFGSGIPSIDDPEAGSNIGIIKNPLGENPQLIAATLPIPMGLTTDLRISDDGQYLHATYPGIGATFVFDVQRMVQTVNSASPALLKTTPIDQINPTIRVAANLIPNEIPFDAPIGTGIGIGMDIQSRGIGIELFKPNVDFVPLSSEDRTLRTVKFNWRRNPGFALSEEPEPELDPKPEPQPSKTKTEKPDIELFISTFPEGQGLFPEDWSPYLLGDGKDYNPNRIFSASWKKGTWSWKNLQGEVVSRAGRDDEFELPLDRTLTGGQTYYWGVRVQGKWLGIIPGEISVSDRFETPLSYSTMPISGGTAQSNFSSVTILTEGVEPAGQEKGRQQIWQIAENLSYNGAAVLRYRPTSGLWERMSFPLRTNEGGSVKIPRANNPTAGQPLVLIADWLREVDQTKVFNSGFAEAAADSLFASLVKFDQEWGGTVEGYNAQGQLIRNQGALFNSPLHFIGFGQGAVVNSEIVQRLGTFFPYAGGSTTRTADGTLMPVRNDLGQAIRDLHVTTIDPYQYDLSLPAADLINTFDPVVTNWHNVTYADNYYQTRGTDDTLRGHFVPTADWNVDLSTRASFDAQTNGGIPHQTAFNWYAGTANVSLGQPQLFDSSLYRRLDDLIFDNPFYRRLGDLIKDEINDGSYTWYTPDHVGALVTHGNKNTTWEGIGTGWFHSTLGGAESLRPYSPLSGILPGTGKVSRAAIEATFGFENYLKRRRTPVNQDNTYANDRDRALNSKKPGDFAVPTLFNGNFDAIAFNAGSAQTIPGWSLSQDTLVEWRSIAQASPDFATHMTKLGINPNAPDYKPNYALQLNSGASITHNRFVVPAWGALRFDIHVPTPANATDQSSVVRVFLGEQELNSFAGPDLPTEQLEDKNEQNNPTHPAVDLRAVSTGAVDAKLMQGQINRIGYGSQGFQTFHVDIPSNLRGKVATLRFEVTGNQTVYLDNIFFKSIALNFGNPVFEGREARQDSTQFKNNYLIEKPQYTVSYNDTLKTALLHESKKVRLGLEVTSH